MYHGEEMTVEELNLLFNKATSHANKWSSDSEKKVGAITSDMELIAANTFVSGATGLPSVRPDKYEYMIHAEANLILGAAARGYPVEGKIIFCTLSPCQNCIRTMFQAGIREVYYKEVYRAYDPNMRDIEITETKVGPYTKMVLSNYESQT
jgi:dCMP deaminase